MNTTAAARALLAALGLVVSASGCGHPLQRTLQGRWMGESVENFDDEMVAAASGWARGTSLEFAGSELTVAIPAEEPRGCPDFWAGDGGRALVAWLNRAGGFAVEGEVKLVPVPTAN